MASTVTNVGRIALLEAALMETARERDLAINLLRKAVADNYCVVGAFDQAKAFHARLDKEAD